MEPMAVSPGKSPVSGGQYLPSFLMGELASPPPGNQAMSPLPSASNYSRSSRSKVEGPPIVGLFDEVNSSPPQSPVINPSTPLNQNTSIHHNNSTMFLDGSTLDNQENRNYWVVVYGFPPNQVNQIIAMFSQLGRIAEHNYPVNGNWVCLCYTNQSDMRKALSMNTKVLSGNVMIGVTERKQQYLIDSKGKLCYNRVCWLHDVHENKYPNNPSYPKYPCVSPISPHSHTQAGLDGTSVGASTPNNTSIANISITSPTSPKIRPLALSRRQNHQSLVNTGPVPTPDTSIVGKFMDFIFSW